MSKKKYIAKSDVSINVVLGSGKNRHISFSAITGGGSVYYTEDEEEQRGIERHYKYGKLFRLDREEEEEPAKRGEPKRAKQTTEEATNSARDEEEDTTEEKTEAYQTVAVSDPDAAKAYLADKFGVSRTKLKYIKTIKEVAAANGIVFEGI